MKLNLENMGISEKVKTPEVVNKIEKTNPELAKILKGHLHSSPVPLGVIADQNDVFFTPAMKDGALGHRKFIESRLPPGDRD